MSLRCHARGRRRQGHCIARAVGAWQSTPWLHHCLAAAAAGAAVAGVADAAGVGFSSRASALRGPRAPAGASDPTPCAGYCLAAAAAGAAVAGAVAAACAGFSSRASALRGPRLPAGASDMTPRPRTVSARRRAMAMPASRECAAGNVTSSFTLCPFSRKPSAWSILNCKGEA